MCLCVIFFKRVSRAIGHGGPECMAGEPERLPERPPLAEPAEALSSRAGTPQECRLFYATQEEQLGQIKPRSLNVSSPKRKPAQN